MSTDPRTAPRKSSFFNSQGACAVVEAGQASDWWRENRGVQTLVSIRNDSDTNVGAITTVFTPEEWRAFTDGVKAGEFDLDEDGLLPARLADQTPV